MIEYKKIGQVWGKAWGKVKETTGKKVTSRAPISWAKNWKYRWIFYRVEVERGFSGSKNDYRLIL